MTESIDTVVVGGGQAGLATGYFLQQQDCEFVILDGSERIGDAWRQRWDSLRLFTPARFNGLPGLPFPAPPSTFPTKDEMGDYLESYAERFELPVRTGVWVDRLERKGGEFVVTTNGGRYEADNVVVAMASYQVPWAPPFADELDPDIVQLHAGDYRNTGQLQDGDVLVVGAGNSGAEIALDVAPEHRTWLSGRDVGNIPFHIESVFGRHVGVPFVLRVLFHHILTTSTPLGRRARPEALSKGLPLVRTKPGDLAAAGVERVPRVAGVRDGLPELDDCRVLDVPNVVWTTGFRPDLSWIGLPIFDGAEHPKEPVHDRGVVADEPGLYFVGLSFLYAMTSSIITGVGRDARYVVDHLAARRA